MDKFHEEKSSLSKFKVEMILASIDLWDVVDGSDKASPSNTDTKVLKEYQRHVTNAKKANNAMSIINLNLIDT